MICPTCRFPEATVGQPCPACGTVASLPGDPVSSSTAASPQPPAFAGQETTAILPGEPTVALPTTGMPIAIDAPAKPKPSKGRVWLIAAVGVLAVLLISGGVAFAGMQLGWFGGGGKQPYEALPKDALAYAQIDLNPAADQKAAAIAFFRELPQMKDAANPNFDYREVIWNEWAKSNDTHGLSYATDIKPWLGQRMGVATLSRGEKGTEPVTVIALAVTDESLATKKLPTLLGSEAAVVDMLNGYAVITSANDISVVEKAMEAGTLAQNPTFAGDLKRLGATGFATGWADLKGLGSIQGSDLGAGRTTFALRFADKTLELAGSVYGANAADMPSGTGGTDLATLPADTAAAISIQGGGPWVAANWDRVKSSLPVDSLTQMGWQLPGDLVALLGTQATVSAGSDLVQAISGMSSGGLGAQPPSVGARFATDQVDRVRQLVQKSDPTGALKMRAEGGKVTVATNDRYLAQLYDPTAPKLSSLAKFNAVVPDATKSTYAAYVDFAPFASLIDQVPNDYADQKPFLKALTSAGFSVQPNGEGASWSLRIARS